MKRIIFKKEILSALPTPEEGYITIGVSSTGTLSTITDTGTVSAIDSPIGEGSGVGSLQPKAGSNSAEGDYSSIMGGENNTINNITTSGSSYGPWDGYTARDVINGGKSNIIYYPI